MKKGTKGKKYDMKPLLSAAYDAKDWWNLDNEKRELMGKQVCMLFSSHLNFLDAHICMHMYAHT